MEEIKKLLEERGFKRIGMGYSNGEETHNYINKETLEWIGITSGDIDTEILLDILGVSSDDFDKMCKEENKEEEAVLKELIEKAKGK